MVDLAILKLFLRDKDIYTKYISTIKNSSIDKEIELLFRLVDRYYKRYQEHNYISQDELLTFLATEYPTLKEPETYRKLIATTYQLETSRDVATDLITKLTCREFANKMANHLLPLVTGQSTDSTAFETITQLITEYHDTVQTQQEEEESPFYEPELDELLVQTESDGLEWRLACLRKALGPLVGGTLGHAFARPEMGKTTFVHSEMSFMAGQLDNGSVLLWINNEEPGSRVRLRTYSAVCGMTEWEIRANRDKAKELFNSHGGQRIKLVDTANISVEQIEKLCREYKPRMVVIDQGDKISYKGDGSAGSTPDRLKNLYDKLREVVKRCNLEWKMDMLTIGQADAACEGKRKLHMSNLDSGKTGKAGAFDYIIGIGSGYEDGNARWLSLCKNKIRGDHETYPAMIDPAKGRYVDAA